MHCEEVRALLFDYIDGQLPQDQADAIAAALPGCPECQAIYDQAVAMQAQARVWHTEPVPAWQAPRIPGTPFLEGFRLWFPTLASTAALLLVAVGWFVPGGPNTREAGPTSVYPGPLQTLPVSTSALTTGPAGAGGSVSPALVEAVMDSTAQQRQLELQALVKLLKAEMDRRSLETEESLRYLVAHQIQEQREVERLSDAIEAMRQQTNEADNAGTPQP